MTSPIKSIYILWIKSWLQERLEQLLQWSFEDSNLRISENSSVRGDDGLHVRHPHVLVQQHVVEKQSLDTKL